MSLNRVSYLESWEQHPPPFIRQRSTASAASADEESRHVHESTEAALLSSSFPSSSHHRAVRHKLSFNPYAGRGWGHSSAQEADEERRSLLRSDHGDADGSDNPAQRRDGEELLTEFVFEDPNWNLAETRGAYEVSKGKRIGRLSSFLSVTVDYFDFLHSRLFGLIIGIAQVFVAVFYCLFAAGPVFGFAAIKPVFIREGVYRDECSKEELSHGLCYGQETR